LQLYTEQENIFVQFRTTHPEFLMVVHKCIAFVAMHLVSS